MAVKLQLRIEDGKVVPWVNGESLAAPVPLESLPASPRDRNDPLLKNPYKAGRPLFEALGGEKLLKLLEDDSEGILVLELEDEAEDIPWEFAAMPKERDLLAARYGMVRLVNRDAPPPRGNSPLQLIFLAADPLVDKEGRPREGYRLQFEDEVRRLRRAMTRSPRQVIARRIPPTEDALRRHLRRGPVILHITSHGDVIDTDAGPVAILALEDETGKEATLPGRDLTRMAPRGVLRLAVLSACHTADGDEARLARALILNGVPAAIGMQGPFPDPLSDDLVETLYGSILDGLDLAEAMRQARQRLLRQHPGAAGLPVLYAARNGWAALDGAEGTPDVRGLKMPGRLRLPQEVQPPRPLKGRLLELHELATLFSKEHRVITITGAGGIGKTALAAAFAERFAWRWQQGVVGISFANEELDESQFIDELIRKTMSEADANRLAAQPPAAQISELLAHLRDWDGLLLLDNYETILQRLQEGGDATHAAARGIHRVVAQLAEGGVHLLLTSREQPAGLRHEITYPPNRALSGLSLQAGAALFMEHSTRAKADPQAHIQLAADVARVTEGHPLAITLLASEFDVSQEVSARDFLANWAQELRDARNLGLAGHHITFAVAFNRSYQRLDPTMQERLRLLSVFPFPFLAEAAAFVWGLVDAEGNPQADAARKELNHFVQRSLLTVDATFSGTDLPASYRFLPVIREEVWARVEEKEREQQERGFAAYGAWLIDRAYGRIGSDLGLARLVRASMAAMDAAIPRQEGVQRIWRSWRLAWLKRSFGDFAGALSLLQPYRQPPPEGLPDDETRQAYSRVWNELATIYTVRGDLEEAMRLYREALSILEQLGDQQGRASTLTMMAQLQAVLGERAAAIRNLQEALAIFQRLGMPRETAQVQEILAQVQGTTTPSLSEPDPLSQHINLARAAHQRGQINEAIASQEEAVRLARERGEDRESLVQLSVLLFNLAGYYAKAGRFEDAVAAMEEVVALDERTGHPDLVSDRQVLAEFRRLAALSPEEREALMAAAASVSEAGEPVTLEDLPKEVQQQILAAIQQMQELGPQGLLVAQVRDAALAVLRGEVPGEVLLAQIEPLAAQIHAEQPPESEWDEAARFLDAVIALLKNQPPPPVPLRYAEDFAAIKSAASS